MVWKIVAGIVFFVLVSALAVQTLIFSNNLGDAQEAQAGAEATAERELVARQEADSARQAAEVLAQHEANLRATAEDRQRTAEQQSMEDAQLRATAEADAEAAQAQAARDSRMRTNAEADLERVESELEGDIADLEDDIVEEKKMRALVEAETSPTLTAIITGEVTFFVEEIPDYAHEDVDNAVSDVTIRLQDMEPHGARVRQTRIAKDADIYVRWVRDFGEHTLATAVHQTVINVGVGSTNCYDEWQAFDAETVTRILWHEFGHAFGYGHSDDPGNIMYPTGETRFFIERLLEDVLIPSGWAWYWPVCESGTYAIFAEVEDSLTFDYAVISPRDTLDDFFSGTATFNARCSSGREEFILTECFANAGSSLVIHNAYHGVPITIRVAWSRIDQLQQLDMEWEQETFSYDEETLDYYRELFADE